MERYKPSFTYTDKIVNLVAEISSKLTGLQEIMTGEISPIQREVSRIRAIHSSLAIEGNTLSFDQVAVIVNGEKIFAHPVEILEVKHADEVYRHFMDFDPMSVDDLLKAYRMMMEDLIPESGRFRSNSVGIFSGTTLIYRAPAASLVPSKIQELFDWYQETEMHPLIKNCIFHYKFEHIHPFIDGNGRMGRFWQKLLLGSWNDLFYWLPFEAVILERQQLYYEVFRNSDKTSDSRYFVEFMLQVLADSLTEAREIVEKEETISGKPYARLIEILGSETLSLSDMMEILGLRHKTNFRRNYIAPALQDGVIEMTIPEKPNSKNQKYRLTPKYRMRSK